MATFARSVASRTTFSTISRSATSNARRSGGSALKRGTRFAQRALDNSDTLFDIPSEPSGADDSLESDFASTVTTSISSIQQAVNDMPKNRRTRSVATYLTFAKAAVNTANSVYSACSGDSSSVPPSPSDRDSYNTSATTGFSRHTSPYASNLAAKYNRGWRNSTLNDGQARSSAYAEVPPPSRGYPSMRTGPPSFLSMSGARSSRHEPSAFAQSLLSNTYSSAHSAIWEEDEAVTAGSSTADTPLPLPTRTENVPPITVQSPLEPSFSALQSFESPYDSDDPSTAITQISAR